MIQIQLECQNIRTRKLIDLFKKFGKSFPFSYEMDKDKNSGIIISRFTVETESALNELYRRLGHLRDTSGKKLEFEFVKVIKTAEVPKVEQ